MNRRWLLTFVLIVAITALCTPVFAQSLMSGDIAGTLTDPSGAVVPNATINLKSLDTGGTQASKTNDTGYYRFNLLKPGRYQVAVSQPGFQRIERPVVVAVGQIVNANLTLEVGQNTQVVEVTAAEPLVSLEPSMNTPFTQAELTQLPSAGGDITNIAFTAPGVTVNVTAGYGNFTVNGLPATSNLFTVNGENDMDPYFNINNSGATNLTLGQNEIQEASVITNPYAGQYGQLSGAQVNYVTRSGSNEFHGNLQYWWNGRALNANNWFSNASDTPRAFSNANQWAGAVGGPIRKNKTFFFVNNEGMRFVLPNVITTYIPTQAFANAVVANVQAKQPNEAAIYKKMFDLYAAAPGAGAATNMPNSSYCNGLALPGFNPATQACEAKFQATPTALASEWILSARVDQKITDKDDFFFRYKGDHGLQPTSLDPISPNFNANSSQPSWDTQAHETHVFGPKSTNEFMATFSHYVAQFQQNHALAVSTFPYDVINSGAVPFTEINPMRSFPQGRNITQYQFIDDVTLNHGAHNFKFGANFRRYDVSDHNFFFNFPAVYFGYTTDGLSKFANGLAYQFRQRANLASDVPIAMYGLGFYAHDDWHVTSKFKLTLALRAERNSNPVCQFNCFANLTGPWASLASVTSATPASVPYSSDIIAGQHRAYPGVDKLDWSPRVGFSWSPSSDNKTVVSGGFGIFYDSPPASLVDNLLTNPPVVIDIRVRPSAGTLGFDPAGGAASWLASVNAFNLNQNFTQVAAAVKAAGGVYSVPAITSISGTIKAPQWKEWNLQIQRELAPSLVASVNYVGNRGVNIPYNNTLLNVYDAYGIFPNSLPAKAKVPNYGQVNQWQSGAISAYDGLTFSIRKQFKNWISAHASYTWSHNLDEASNGGVSTYGDSLFGQFNPISLRSSNYGSSDYDFRHSFVADFVVNPSFHASSPVAKQLVNGWKLSGKWFWRSGLPFSVIDGNWNGGLGNSNATLLATPIGARTQGNCGRAAVDTSCLNPAQFLDSAADSFNGFNAFSTQTRNQYRGPSFFDIDMSLFKTFKFSERGNIGVGVQAFNVFNTPHFGNPDNALGSSTFGQITGVVGNPTTPYGNFLGFDSSPRVIQVTAKLVF